MGYHLGGSLEDMRESVLHDSQRLVQVFQNADDRKELLDVGLGPLKDHLRVELGAVEVVAAEGHHLASVVSVVKHACARNELAFGIA